MIFPWIFKEKLLIQTNLDHLDQKNKKNNKKLSKQISEIIYLLKKSKRPVIILGGGIRISKTIKELQIFLKKFTLPIVTTWSGVDSIKHDNNNYIGNIGVYGSRAANFVIQNSDFVLSLGSRLDTRITGGVPKNFAREAVLASVDIDKDELNKKRGLKIKIKVNES